MEFEDNWIKALVGGILALGLSVGASSATAEAGDMEKCYGIVNAGMNDCGTTTNTCQGTAKTSGDKSAWIFVPKGTCEKIVGGSTKAG